MLGVTGALPSAVATGSGEADGRPEKLSPHSPAWFSTVLGVVVREGRADGVPGRLLGPLWMPCPRQTLDPRPWIPSAPSPPAPGLAVLEPNDKCSSPDGLCWGGGGVCPPGAPSRSSHGAALLGGSGRSRTGRPLASKLPWTADRGTWPRARARTDLHAHLSSEGPPSCLPIPPCPASGSVVRTF